MAFALSPGVTVVEKDFTSIVPNVSTSAGAFAGTFVWGPVLDPVTITSETTLVQRFGKPQDDNATSFFTAANFLAYANNLLVVRVDTANHRNAVSTQSGTVTGTTNLVGGTGYTPGTVAITYGAPNITGGVQALGHATASAGGVITSITIDNPGTGYTSAPAITFASGAATANSVVTVGGIKINNETDYVTNFYSGAGVVGGWAAKYPGILGNSLKVSMADSVSYAAWAYKDEFTAAPGSSVGAIAAGGTLDELHVIIIDEDGQWTGTQGAILEKYAFVSKANDNFKADGSTNYYKQVINSQSRYVWWMDHPTAGTNWGGASGLSFATLSSANTSSLTGGLDDLTATDGQLMSGFALFADDVVYDISLVAVGKASATVASYVISSVVENRKDCMAFISAEDVTTGDIIKGNSSESVDAINAYRDALPSTSYACLDTGFKYQYDRYNDKYRWIPLNGDVAGLCARTDTTNDAWWSPSGLNRGQIKNVVKLAINPGQTERDNLYKNGVNPVVNFPGQGTVLYGDKTLLVKPSAFDRINVRRLFIVLEKAIATSAKFQLFEFNDAFTRNQFKSAVEPFLRGVQGRRGIIDFRVKCDETNNTGDVIDRNEFVAEIYVKPNRSINFITLTFIAARTGVSFSEIGA
ncbi:tail sheath protein [uncultured Caudovirales phage]|uniref:Tail sheath protein n=1 Tax=uncultured Caudovirales phage TaxID=2100421 RepID=A0A6J5PWJ3_9CAUD|nr:tail sheath protein [uncultured Caudovirales phage]CAB4170973.1 tail sheath protein [uncultured Caudovirales phage]CAB4176213.1 tail sheath protein [uncultured Caudovirales phage]CAB4223044.1 tail sheath protein [uncultured Caudovirales phage]